MFKYFLVLLCINLAGIRGVWAACSVSTNGGLGEPQPLLLKTAGGVGNDAFFLPNDSSGTVLFADAEVVDISCPGSEVLVGGASTGLETTQATCSSGSNFIVNGQTVPFSSITCSSYPFTTAQYTGALCNGASRQIEIGFQIGARFLRQLEICFDDIAQTSLWCLFDLTKTIAGFQSGFPRPSWTDDNFFNVGSLGSDNLYARVNQMATINGILGLPANSEQWISSTSNFFFSRGHLAAKADFVYGSQHRTTFHLVNAVPQWQTMNGANWNVLETNVRDYASSHAIDLKVYTGVHGVLTLPDVNGVQQELYLYVDQTSGAKGIPVPFLSWKLVYDPIAQTGTVFITANNPYDTIKLPICTDISASITWISWNADNAVSGFSYACTYVDAKSVISNIPDLTVVDTLP